MALFVATYVNKIDRKGRVSVPAPFRAALLDTNSFIAVPSFTLNAIEGYPLGRIEALADAIADGMVPFSEEQDDYARLIFSTAHQLTFDPEGRIALPETLIAHAGITDQVAFAGMGRTFQIWDPGVLAERRSESKERARTNPPRLPVGLGIKP